MENDVLRLKVPVNYLVFMHIVESLEWLLNDVFSKWLREFSFLLQKVIKLTWIAQFQNEINKLMVAKKGVQLDNVGVA